MTAKVELIAEVARAIQKDCEADAEATDSTPFTPRGVGTQFGNTLAMVSALARCVESLADELAATDRVLASRTDHLV